MGLFRKPAAKVPMAPATADSARAGCRECRMVGPLRATYREAEHDAEVHTLTERCHNRSAYVEYVARGWR